ncbi:hypothetical protein H2C53_002898 [Escherichia coli]|nr:hypothetical protein [Escherichia coli]
MRKTGNRRERGAKTTIVRRQIKKNHAGHHGGAWKVAFADFTLAMMALFMTLWIVNSVVNPSVKALSPRCTGSRFLTVAGCRR